MLHPNRRRNPSALSLIAIVLLVGLNGCGGGSDDNSSSSFNGMNQTYVLSSGNRKLQLQGKKGSYTAVTFAGINTMAVSLKEHTISIGGQSFPYLADHNLFQGGGFVGYADNAVVDDPAKVPGTFNTLTGANFPGQLTIGADHKFTWCQRSNFNGSGGCNDGSVPISGTIVALPLVGFRFSGVAGNYAVYQQGAAGAIFPVDNRGLNLKAVTETAAIPRGTFSQCLMSAPGANHVAKLSFSGDSKLTIKGIPNFSGTYSYSYANGAISFSSSACRNGTCTGTYNDQLGLVYLAQIGNAIFFKR